MHRVNVAHDNPNTGLNAPEASPSPLQGDGQQFLEDRRGMTGRRLSSQDLSALTALDVRRSVQAIARTLTLTLAALLMALLGAFRADALWVWIIAVPVIACCQHAIFVLVHESAHYRLFANRTLNDVIGRLLAASVGISMCSYRIVHRLHHNHLYGALDPDLALHGGYPRGRTYLLRKLLVDLTGLTAYKTYRYFFFAAPSANAASGQRLRPLDDTAPALKAAALRDRRWVIVFQISTVLALAAIGGAKAVGAWVVLWVLPAFTILQAILRIRAILEHGAPLDISDPMGSARTCLAGPFSRWVLFPHHVNYHIEHHLYPAVPHYNLPALHARLLDLGVLAHADVRPISQAWRRVYADRVAAKS
jgi:fatty acid desaturase